MDLHLVIQRPLITEKSSIGREEENLRMALWLREKYPDAMVISRASEESIFANEVGKEHNIISVSINQLVEEHLPIAWVRF